MFSSSHKTVQHQHKTVDTKIAASDCLGIFSWIFEVVFESKKTDSPRLSNVRHPRLPLPSYSSPSTASENADKSATHTQSASTSNPVGSRLTIISFAPHRRASAAIPAAGCT